MSRRAFLARVGLLAGAGAAGLLLRRMDLAPPEAVEVGRPALGTWVRISTRGADPDRAGRGIERAFAAIRRVDAQMSIHRPDSQVSRVNAAAGRALVPADREVMDVVSLAAAVARRTDGVYDPTVLPLMRLYGFYASGQRTYPTDREILATLDRTGWRYLRIDDAGGRLGLERSGMSIDLGSIGKGWALDRAVEALRREGIEAALVDVGGNVYGLGAPPENPEGWTVGVLHPATGRIDHVFHLRDAAVGTSGNSEQSHWLGSVRVGHLLDARRGRPADGPLAASVKARTGVEADYLSTVAFLVGPERLRAWPEVLSAHFVG